MSVLNDLQNETMDQIRKMTESVIEKALKEELKRLFIYEIWKGKNICDLDVLELKEFLDYHDMIIQKEGGELKMGEVFEQTQFNYHFNCEITPATIKIYKRMV